jgi:hypothetical protein
LDRISQVLSRSDKIIQMRVLVGLLGLDPEQDTDRGIDKILTQAQEAPLHKEWVRIIAGLTQGQMLLNQDKRNRLNAMAGSSAAASTAAVSGVPGRASKLRNNKARMK